MMKPFVLRGDMCSVSAGNRRNEDYAIVQENLGACLADGIGGEEMGDLMARCACGSAMKALKDGGTASQCLSCAQDLSRNIKESLGCEGAGAALTVVRCNGEEMQVAWAGDVLCLLLDKENGELKTLTEPDRGMRGLTNAVGMEELRANVLSCKINKGDRVVLCSDGLWDYVSKDEMRTFLRDSRTPREAAVKMVMGRGSGDDATAVVLFADGYED